MAGGVACGHVRTNEGVYGDELIWRPFIRSQLPTVYRRLCCKKFASHRRLMWPDFHSKPYSDRRLLWLTQAPTSKVIETPGAPGRTATLQPIGWLDLYPLSLILDIHVMVNRHLSKQCIRWPVSCDHILGSSRVKLRHSLIISNILCQ